MPTHGAEANRGSTALMTTSIVAALGYSRTEISGAGRARTDDDQIMSSKALSSLEAMLSQQRPTTPRL